MPVNILLLESDRQMARNFQTAFSLKGHKVTIHSDLQNAVLTADKLRPDIIITDLILAGRSGIEFLYELRSYPDWQKIPVIALGKLTREEQAAFSLALDQFKPTIYLHKPSLSFNRLAAEVDKLLQPANA